MQSTSLFYEPSETIHPPGFAAAYAFGLAATAILAYFYTLIVQFSPIIYVNAVVTIGLGLTLGLLVRLLTRFARIRSVRHQLFLAVVLGLWANYCQWCGFLIYAVQGTLPSAGTFFGSIGMGFAAPAEFFGFISEINRLGMWEVFSLPFRGFPLTLVWLIEFAIILVLPIVSVFRLRPVPYTEELQQWYPKYTLDAEFEAVLGPDRFVDQLCDDPLTALRELGDGLAFKYSKVHLHYLPEATHQYLSVEKIYLSDRGRGGKEVTHLIDNFRLDRHQAKAILDTFAHHQAKWDW